jgi:hypothetical protein
VVKQPKILENDADSAAQLGAFGRRDVADIVIEQVNFTLRWVYRHEQEPQQRGLSGP